MQQVHYHSGGLRLNPNLYSSGKVCLSLLNTWTGHQNEQWIPGVSTILQVLVFIQGLILVAKPFFNEPGYAHLSNSQYGEISSLKYNEDTFILSLRTMIYIMRRPPKVWFLNYQTKYIVWNSVLCHIHSYLIAHCWNILSCSEAIFHALHQFIPWLFGKNMEHQCMICINSKLHAKCFLSSVCWHSSLSYILLLSSVFHLRFSYNYVVRYIYCCYEWSINLSCKSLEINE